MVIRWKDKETVQEEGTEGMSANNTIVLIGRVGRDPETRTIASGKSVSKFSLAVNRPGKDQPADWFQVEVWGKQAELAAELIRKGQLISVAGACHIDEWTDKDGSKQRAVKVAADGFQLLERREDSQRQQAPMANDFLDDDSIPPF